LLPSHHKPAFIVSLEASQCRFPFGMMCVANGGAIHCQRFFFLFLLFFSLLPSKIMLAMQNFRVVFMRFQGPYTFDFKFFVLGFFVKIDFFFNYILQSQFVIYYFSNLVLILFIVIWLKLIFLLIFTL